MNDTSIRRSLRIVNCRIALRSLKERKNDDSEGKVGKRTKASHKRKRSRGSRW
jgi:hypothetical protein